MREAIEQAQLAAQLDEVPVGAVVLDARMQILSRAHDERMRQKDATAHAEILAIRRAGEILGDWRLEGCSLVVTLEPCPMCAGALIMSRVQRLYYGAPSPKSGSVESLARILELPGYNHRVEACGGILAGECGQILSDYFSRQRRAKTLEG